MVLRTEEILRGLVRCAMGPAKGIQIRIFLPDVFDLMGQTGGEFWASPLFDDRQRHIDPRGHSGRGDEATVLHPSSRLDPLDPWTLLADPFECHLIAGRTVSIQNAGAGEKRRAGTDAHHTVRLGAALRDPSQQRWIPDTGTRAHPTRDEEDIERGGFRQRKFGDRRRALSAVNGPRPFRDQMQGEIRNVPKHFERAEHI